MLVEPLPTRDSRPDVHPPRIIHPAPERLPMDLLTLYTFEDADGDEPTTYTTRDYVDAKAYAREHGYRVIENRFELADSEMIDDFTPPPHCGVCGAEMEDCCDGVTRCVECSPCPGCYSGPGPS